MYWHTVDYKARGDDVRGALVNRGFWLYLPRRPLVCRLAGHVPVVDGTSGFNGRPGSRWVCCDRCGIRPDPQGSLDPGSWGIGDPIDLDSPVKDAPGGPGTWPAVSEGTIGGQLIVGGHVTAGVSVKVGNAGSEHVLAAHACLPYVGGLYLHTEGFGTGIQRRLNPVGYESKVISLDVSDGRAHWKLWAKRDGSRGTPRWRDGSARIDPRDILLGERRYSYVNAGGTQGVTLFMPDGSQHWVVMKLQRQAFGRKHGRQRLSWTVDCDCREGIPTRSDGHRGGMCGWAVPVSDQAVEAGAWQQEAVAASIVKITGMRIRYRYMQADRTAA